MRLSRKILGQLPPSIVRPGFDTAQVRPGIVHLGLGGFHRAHMARYTHELMECCPEALRWGIVGAGLLASDRTMQEALVPQDNLYTLVERDGAHEHARVIGSLAGVIYAGNGSAELLSTIDGSGIAIVSITVTEAGYGLNPATKRLDPSHPLISDDLRNNNTPRTVVGVLVEAYRRRRQAALPAFTALTCDNIQSNGKILRSAVLDFAERVDPSLADWIAERARFPDTMVDRITPATTENDRLHLEQHYGVTDAWPVFSETFSQWIIKDDFVADRPTWEEVGAQFVSDVEPYEMMKLRLLNASHLAISGLGRLIGAHHVDQAMRLDNMRNYMAQLMDLETGPTLRPVPGVDLYRYKCELLDRFANPSIRDTVDRVNADAPLNVLLDPIKDRLARQLSSPLLSLALAAWIRRFRGEDEQGRLIDLRHPDRDLLQARSREGGSDPRPVLGIRSLFGELGDCVDLVAEVGGWLTQMDTSGVAATLQIAARDAGPTTDKVRQA